MKWTTTILILCVAVLTGLGMVMLYSSSMNMEINRAAVGAYYLRSQLVWLAIGAPACVAVACFDYRLLKKPAPYLLGFFVCLLVLVYLPKPIGAGKINGAYRWVRLPGLPNFQPSELAKLALLIFLAAYADHYQRRMGELKRGLLIPGLVMAIPLGLIFLEPDRGDAMLLASICGAILILAGVRMIYFAVPAAGAAALVGYLLMHEKNPWARIQAWLNPEMFKDTVGYQAYQAMIALGSGGIFGLGLGNGRQKLGFVPEHHTDFIFSIAGEEMGLICTLGIMALFLTLLVCGCLIARRSCDTFGFLLAAGITFMITLQAFINMGVVTSLLPNKGMPLPFISYGGSNLLLMCVCVGLLLSVSRYGVEPETVVRSANPFVEASDLTHV